MHILFVLCLVASLIFFSCAKRYEHSDGAGERLDNLRALAAQSSSGLIELDDTNYEYFAIDKPRDYNLIVFLTANNPKYKCEVCKLTNDQVLSVASEFRRSVAKNTAESDTFFIKLDFEHGGQVFTQYKLQTVPILFYLSKRDGMGDGKSAYNIPLRDRYSFPELTDEHKIAEWVSYKTDVTVVIAKSMIMVYVMTILCFGGIAALVPYIINSLDTFWLPLVQSKALWVIVSGGVYICSISGLMYDIIRSPPWYHHDSRGTYFFYPQSQQQFILEGFIVGLLNIGCAGALLWTVVSAPRLQTAEKRLMGMIGGIATFIALFWQVRNLYVMKNRWYGHDI